jgi:hypothetical protein
MAGRLFLTHTLSDSAKRMCRSTSWVYEQLRKGNLQGYKLGGSLYIRGEELLAMLKPVVYRQKSAEA